MGIFDSLKGWFPQKQKNTEEEQLAKLEEEIIQRIDALSMLARNQCPIIQLLNFDFIRDRDFISKITNNDKAFLDDPRLMGLTTVFDHMVPRKEGKQLLEEMLRERHRLLQVIQAKSTETK